MERRVLDIATGRRYLSKKRGSLSVSCDTEGSGASEHLVPFDEIESIIVHTPQAAYSNGAIVELARRGIPLVCCDAYHTPAAWVWPIQANYEQSRRMAAQAKMPDELRAALWAVLIRAKLEAQAAVLHSEGHDAAPLEDFACRVTSDNCTSLEAHGARLYWTCLFGDDFRRRRDGLPPNGLLNYGYAVLRATVARNVCASGLHPSLGLQHHNRFNAFCLADDLMEPFRPAVDRSVLELQREGHQAVDVHTKSALAAVLARGVTTSRGVTPLSRCVEWAAQSLTKAVLEGEPRIHLPDSRSIAG
ncbi:MAG: type II CRISPR-associated endonuclease Cas1 [Acidimicrobiales bacterium]|nr:type II CRISPR-associated endonuclease Cas1 [Acidimicrobiales bacterium]MXZ14868.1 type II CRISPR-associated endonuclease Cas1 [Acidimicrobiales bacterium]MYB81636.1 type II CRISPR-associated endonuclease Cas1 [Acidimicrobiales bacterium]MYG62419.1 type II CRISPR-associated endonuclease Cas1 [Acidimicrobiales bacterium]MYI11459.1 type II CRISPR-associated endonuclease Cas1 [Acidimicrobiales bacterium]